jgi:hypothetical protein
MTEFKVGDKVRVNNRFDGSHSLIGSEGEIKYATHEGSLFDWFVDIEGRDLDLAVHAHEIDLTKADTPKKGDWVRVVKYRDNPEHTRVGWEGEVINVTSAEVHLRFPNAGAENAILNTRYGWFLLDEVEVIEKPDPQPLAQKDDQGLREAIGLLPGLDNASLTWDDETDPVEFLLEYGQVLAGQLKYYKKKEAKLEKISEALEVLYDA